MSFFFSGRPRALGVRTIFEADFLSRATRALPLFNSFESLVILPLIKGVIVGVFCKTS